MVKYVFVTGGVMSGIGKGVLSASIGKILQTRGFKVTAIKIDPYLNVDAGTMNPYIHGEVFVTEDGGETDMDLGTYERFLDTNLSKNHNITTGQIYISAINKERRGDFLGRCVQIIPHITDEIKNRMHSVIKASDAEIAIIEIGGTVGDIEGLPFLEAARQVRLEEGFENVLYVHVTLVPVLDVVGEQKTKPTQHSVQELRRIGIQPDVIVARSKELLKDASRKKIALFCNVDEKGVFSAPDLKCIYESPLVLDEQGMGDYMCRRLSLPKKGPDWNHWKKIVKSFTEPTRSVKIAICGKYAGMADCYVSVNEALKHAGAACNVKVELRWIETEIFERDPSKLEMLSENDGILVPGGFGIRGAEGKIVAIKYARENNIPFLGICFGFQLATVEFARSTGLEKANSVEIDPESPYPIVDLMPEQKEYEHKGATMRLGAHEVLITPGTLAFKLYNSRRVYERHRHRYEINLEYKDELEKNGLVFSGKSPDGKRMEVLEVPTQKFHLATQFHSEFKSRPGKPAPPYYGFIKACLEKANYKT
ncbi:MAG: CTP synthase (glutamine hydrolyzing) [Candidatus Bathyarchaeia archaeon]